MRPELAVASVNGMPYVAECLDSLAMHAPEAEVAVTDWTDEDTRSLIRQRWTEVNLLSFDEPNAVPELRAAGIEAASAPYVALIEDRIPRLDLAGSFTSRRRSWFRCLSAASSATSGRGLRIESLSATPRRSSWSTRPSGRSASSSAMSSAAERAFFG